MNEKVRAHPPKFSERKLRRAHVFISGRVQGVFFRDSCQRRAQKLGIKGWVKNLSDGRVEAVFEGEKDKVAKMLNWTERGPILAKVKDLQVEWPEYRGEFSDFIIHYE